MKVGATFLGALGLGLTRPFFDLVTCTPWRGVVWSSMIGEERGSDRAGADGRTGTAVELRQGELVFSSPEIAFSSRGLNLPHGTLEDYN